MKKMFVLALILVFTVCMLTGCGGDSTAAPSNEPSATQETTTTTDSTDATAQLKELEQKNIQLVEVYNEVAALAVQNGWDKDAATVTDFNAADAIIQEFNLMIKDPSSAEGADMTELLSIADEMTTELDTNIRAKVSVPIAGK